MRDQEMENKSRYILQKIRYFYSFFERYNRRNHIQGLVRNGLKLGSNVDIIDTFFFDPSHCFLISIGDNCTICPNVRLIAHDASTKKHLGYTKIGRITILENCFIGDSVIVLPNVTIGPNVIVGAGSVVTKNIPPYTVAAGNPARKVSSFSDYLVKTKGISSGKKVFDESYLIYNLDKEKREEIMKATDGSLGFIV
jgi:maltose O-acetyltransferase